MSASPIARQAIQPQGQAIPRRIQINDASQLPHDYSSTPGGTLYSTTPGGSFYTNLSYQIQFSMNSIKILKNLFFLFLKKKHLSRFEYSCIISLQVQELFMIAPSSCKCATHQLLKHPPRTCLLFLA